MTRHAAFLSYLLVHTFFLPGLFTLKPMAGYIYSILAVYILIIYVADRRFWSRADDFEDAEIEITVDGDEDDKYR